MSATSFVIWEGYESARELRHASAVNAVRSRSARLRVLAADCARHGLAVDLPEPVDTDRAAEHLERWCETVDEALTRIEARLSKHRHRQLLRSLRVAEGIELPEISRPGLVRAETRRSKPDRAEEIAEYVSEHLSHRVSDADREELLDSILPLSRRGGDELWKEELRFRIQRLNERNRRAVADREQASRLLDALRNRLADTAGAAELRSALEAVADGEGDLDDRLVDRADAALKRAELADRGGDIRQRVISALTDLGYEVSADAVVMPEGMDRFTIERGDWRNHAVAMVFRGAEGVGSTVVRTGSASHAEDERREQQWCEDLERVRGRLSESGLGSKVDHSIAPGERKHVPVQRRKRRHDAAQRERNRE